MRLGQLSRSFCTRYWRLTFIALAYLTVVAAPALAEEAAGAPSTKSAGWVEHLVMQLEKEAVSDIGMLPATPSALSREWRSFDSAGSANGALVDVGWVAFAALIAVGAERLVGRSLGRGVRRRMRSRAEGPTLPQLLWLLVCDVAGIAVLAAIFIYSRHWLLDVGATLALVLVAANTLIRWRFAAAVIRIILRPDEPTARLIGLDDREARRLAWFLSGCILIIDILIGFGRHGLTDEDSGAHHVIGVLVAALVCSLIAFMVFRARGAAEALIRGRADGSVVAALRAGLARAWLAIGLTWAGGLFVFFVFGLSLGLLSYFDAAVNSFAVLFVLLVFEGLAERGANNAAATEGLPGAPVDRLLASGGYRVMRAVVLLAAVTALAWIWIDAIELSLADAVRAKQSTAAAVATTFVAYLAWELIRLAIDRHVHPPGNGPKLPGADDEDEEAAPASRFQTMLPMLRAAFGVVICVLAVLIVLSRLGIDTAPLIAGAGVLGLAVSFGSQSLVRDIISGLFYMWDDAFRVGEYIDTGRLRGTVETIGVRSVKLRHHNGPLHTIPYGQLGAVTNLSRDFATIKFNLRLEPGSDIELVRKTAKQVGLTMQENPEIATEVLLPLKMQGIAEITDNAVVVRFKFTARPVKPSWIQREYLKRLYRVFAEKGIVFASGALVLQQQPVRPGEAPETDTGAIEDLVRPKPRVA